jgi:hypothetical protein
MRKKLSDYTYARYCSDEADLLAGLREINEAMEYRKRTGKAIPRYYYSRRYKLMEKLKPVITKGLNRHEFRYGGHIFKAERPFKPHEDFGYVGRRLTRLVIHGWDWDEFYTCAHAVGHENLSLHNADIFLMDRDIFVVPCTGFLGKYVIE